MSLDQAEGFYPIAIWRTGMSVCELANPCYTCDEGWGATLVISRMLGIGYLLDNGILKEM